MRKEEIEQAREMDLLLYLQRYEPEELVHFSGNTYWREKRPGLSGQSERDPLPAGSGNDTGQADGWGTGLSTKQDRAEENREAGLCAAAETRR